VFDYGVAFTGFSRVVYSPVFVLGVAFTGYFYLVCSKDHCLEKSGIQNADPALGNSEDGWMWATSGGQVNSDLDVWRQEGSREFSGLPGPGCEGDHSQGDGGLHHGRSWRPGKVEEGVVVEGHPGHHDGPVEYIVPGTGHPGA
jgi:hypothetical protein